MATTFTVTTLTDENDAGATVAAPGGAGLSLREAIALANTTAGADTITFDASLNGTIRLDGGDGPGGTAGATLSISDEATIEGDGRVTISGDADHDDVSTDGTSDVTDIFASQTAASLADNVQILVTTADLTLEGLVLTGGVSSGSGGAVFGINVGIDITLTDTTISGNLADSGGGGIMADAATLTNSTVSGNSAFGHGGGIIANAVTLTNSTVSGNEAGTIGGGIYGGTANLTNSTVSGNSADFDGGGIFASAANLTNSTVSGNSAADDGGGIKADTATLTNSTVSGNSAADDGGGIVADTATLTNSIVLGNDAATNDEIAGTLSPVGGLNIVGVGADTDDGDGVINALSVDAVFAAVDGTTGGGLLADNGGPVQTIALKEDASNPALDAGDDDATGVPATDARGVERADSGAPEGDGDISDLGAFEVTHDFVVTTLDDVVDASDGEMSLREAIDLANGNDGADTITFDASLSGTIRLDGGDGAGGTVGGTLSITDEVTIDGDSRILITGDVNNDDTTVGTTDVTDIFASQTAATLGDNVRILDATADLTLDGLTLTGGSTGGSGGAVLSNAIVTLTTMVVSGNRGVGAGGGIRADTATVTNSTISGNVTSGSGGGINASTATLTNTTVSGNSAGDIGGGIRATNATLTNSTVSGNSAGNDGGGINVTVEATLTNSIVLGNDAVSTGDEVFAGTTNYAGLNIVGVGADADGGDGMINATSVSAVFASVDATTGGGVLADNGGPVQTIALRHDLTNPALDASDNTAPPNDARSEARQDWAGIANQNGAPADLGAYELLNAAPAATNLTQAKTYLEDAAGVDLDNIVVSDADIGDTITARLTLANTEVGILTTSGAATYSALTGIWTITGTLADANAALAAVAFVPAANFNGDTTITTHIEDAQGDGPADGTISLDGTPVNDAPIATNLTQAKAYLEDAASADLDNIDG